MTQRWHTLRRKLRFHSWQSQWPLALGIVTSVVIAVVAMIIFFASGSQSNFRDLWQRTPLWLYPLLMALGWLPWLWKFLTRGYAAWKVGRGLRVLQRPWQPLRQILMHLTTAELSNQALPNQDRTDDRYELLTKLQGILATLGFGGVYVLVDRVDEPYLINGSAELMKALIWPLLDNKLLKHPGLGVKLMLPADLKYFIEREGRDFAQRARLDKQNMVPSLAWTGEALFDVSNARLRACASPGRTPSIQELFDDAITHQRLLEGFRSLRVPRHLHKFLYQLLVSHCNAYTDDDPRWKIAKDRFESELALYERDMAEQRT